MGGRFESDAKSVESLYKRLKNGMSDENIRHLKLHCFSNFLESKKTDLLEDGISYLFDCFKNRYDRKFFNSLLKFYQEKKCYIPINTPKAMSKTEINQILNELLIDECNSWIEDPSFIKLSQILQINVYVKTLKYTEKLMVYSIDNSPYSMFIVQDIKSFYILKPFDMNYDWTGEDFHRIFRRYMDIEKEVFDEKCSSCKCKTRHLYCENFHSVCLKCMLSVKCEICSKVDYKLLEYFSNNIELITEQNSSVMRISTTQESASLQEVPNPDNQRDYKPLTP